MKETYTVTGIRFHMQGEKDDDRRKETEYFLQQLPKGKQVRLVPEPENTYSKDAIAVYVDYRKVGYISDNEAKHMHSLFADRLFRNAEVESTDHITFFVTIPDATETLLAPQAYENKLPLSPLGDEVRLGHTHEEGELMLIAEDLLAIEVSQAHLPELLNLLSLYSEHRNLSVCHEDICWLDRISKKCTFILQQSKEWEIMEKDRITLGDLCKTITETVGDYKDQSKGKANEVFENHFDRIVADTTICDDFFRKYCKAFLNGQSFEEASPDLVSQEYDRLNNWLQSLKWPDMRKLENLKKMGLEVNYVGLNRAELYQFMAVLLIMKQLDAHIPSVIVTKPATGPVKVSIVSLLANTCFYGIKKDANDFYQKIQKKSAVEITDLVRSLVEKRVIYDERSHKELWKILHDANLYDRTLANWNEQLRK